nr:MAG: RNA helicase [Guiyang dicistrovirus 3]
MNMFTPLERKGKFHGQKLISDLMYKRNHPIYPDWKDWALICHTYYDPKLQYLSSQINKAHWKFNWRIRPDSVDRDFFFEIDTLRSQYTLEIAQGEDTPLFPYWVDHHFGCPCEGAQADPTCRYYEYHVKSHIIAVMWAFYENKSHNRNITKYFKRLERVILAMTSERLKHMPPDMIYDPMKYAGALGRSILRRVYELGYLDYASTEEITEKIEYLKNFRPAREQGGTVQSPSALNMSEFIQLTTSLLETNSLEEILDRLFKVKEQSLFSVNHKIDDGDLTRLKDVLSETRTTFVDSFGSMLIHSGQSLMVMFAIASTIGVLAQSACGTASTLLLKVLHVLYGLIFGSESEVAIKRSAATQQSGDGNISVPFLPAMFLDKVLGVPKTILTKIWHNPNIDTTMRRLSFLGDQRVDRGLERLVLWVSRVIRQTRAWYCREILGLSVPDDLEDDSQSLKKWHSEVDDLVKSYYNETLVWSETTWSVVYNLYARGLTYTRSRLYVQWHQEIFRVITKLGNILEKFKQHQRDGQSIRNPPVTIYLAGGTGVGKSSITYPLSVEILKEIYSKEGGTMDLREIWKSLIYMRSAEQEFWDGYENQLITVFDDFCQQADSASNPNLELFEIIRASNCFPYPLHMASLDQKATTSFTSKVILVSSNLEKPKTQSLNFPEALYRRFDICVEVRRKKDCEGKMETFNPDIYDLSLYEMATGKRLRSITYKELVLLCAEQYFSRSKFVNSVDGYIDNILNQPCASAQEQGPIPSTSKEDPDMWDEVFNTSPFPPLDPKYVHPHDANLIRHIVARKLAKAEGFVHFARRPGRAQEAYDAVKWFVGTTWEKGKELLMKVPSPFGELEGATNYLRTKLGEIQECWERFKVDHPYIFKSLIVVSLMVTALAFLKMFLGIMNFGKAKMDIWRDRTPRSVRTESYNIPILKTAKNESYSASVIPTAKVESYSIIKAPTARVEGAIEEGVKDLNATEILHSIVRRNLYKMYESTHNTPIGHCIFLKGKIALMPKHFAKAFRQAKNNDPEATIYFKSALLQRSFEMKASDMLSNLKSYCSPEESSGPVISRDLMAIWVDASIIHPDMTNVFCTRESLSSVNNAEVVLPVMVNNSLVKSDTAVLMLRFRSGRSALSQLAELSVGDSERDCIRYVRNAWRYEADTQPTECGAPLLVRNTRIGPGKVCGIHIAGIEGTGEGFATPLYRDDAEKICDLFCDRNIISQEFQVELGVFPVEQGQIPENSEFIRLGALDKPIYQPKRTVIEPSLCYAKIRPPVTQPCQLTASKDFDPRKYRLSRLGNFPNAFPRDLVVAARNAFVDELSCCIAASKDNLPDSVKAVYSFEEAVKGIDGDRFVNSIKRTTSPGFPYVRMPGMMTRKAIFGNGDEYDLATIGSGILESRVEEILEKARKGVALDHYFIDTLKDERKPIHKAHKTRLFSAGPIDYLIACKMYFNGPVALLQYNRNWSHVSVGTNPYSTDWGEIAKTLLSKSGRMVAGDFEGFDASQHQMLLEASGQVLIEISRRFLGATEEDIKVMDVLMSSLLSSLHICGREVYQWTHSLPSGHYLTAPINSIFVNLAFCCAWMLSLGKVDAFNARSFWRDCGIVAYGDDHIVSIPPHRTDLFNQLTLPELFQQIGLSYTMEDKDKVATQPYRNLFEVTYLKRGFSRDAEGEWLAPLSLDTILETPMWMHKCPDAQKQTVENLEWALKELSLHTAEVWQKWAPVLLREEEALGSYSMLVDQDQTRLVCRAQNIEM